MFWILALVLLVMWVVALVTSFIVSGFVHILLGLAVVLMVMGVVQRLRPSRHLDSGLKPPVRLDPGAPPEK